MSAGRIAADLEARIRSGDLPPGARLPTHRDPAREHGVALSTATRAMRLLARRGLVTGEVGRGSFVRAPGHAGGAVLRIEAGPPGVIDLGGNVMPLRRREAVAALARRRRSGPGARNRTQHNSMHLWLDLPKGLRAADATRRAADAGVRVTAGEAFAVAGAPNAVRLALGRPLRREDLAEALRRLASAWA